ncbi:Tumor protein 63 [Nymphon striatum]|nr:Tumor protein 63 [Nymphon striatum]
MEDDGNPILLNSQDTLLSENTFVTLLDQVQAITQQGILERDPAVTFSELGTDNTFDFELERFSVVPPQDGDDLLFLNPPENTVNHDTQQNENKTLINEPAFNMNEYSLVSSELLANNNWPGNFNFHISFDTSQEKKTKGAAWTYSEAIDKLFINIASACPIRIHTSQQPNSGSIIRITPVFSKAADAATVVRRCYEHSLPSDPTNYNFCHPEHLIRIENTKAEYCTDYNNGRMSVVVPYENPQEELALVEEHCKPKYVDVLGVDTREQYEMLLKIKETFDLAVKVSPEYRERNKLTQMTEIIPKSRISASPPESSDTLWLTDLKMEAYFDAFVEEGISEFSQLSEMTQEVCVFSYVPLYFERYFFILQDSGMRILLGSEEYLEIRAPGVDLVNRISLSQGSQQSGFTCSQDSTTSNSRGFTITRYKVSHHASVVSDHDF